MTVSFIIPVKIENERLKLALAIPIGGPITVANDATKMLPVVTDKTMTYQNSKKKINLFSKSVAHWLSFFNLSNKILFNSIDFV